jgi:RNA polymerase sigma-70 factor (ECF subfamily)
MRGSVLEMARPHPVASVPQSDGVGPVDDEGFYEEYLAPLETRMLRTVWRVVHDEERARDALQDALVVTWRRRERIRAHPNPEALILRICIHAAIDASRRSRRHDVAVELQETLVEAPGGGPVTLVEAREMREQVRAAIQRLPAKQATAVWMRVLEGCSYRAVAEALECAEVTARVHVRRGRARLGRLLAHLAPGSRTGGGET